MGKQNKEHKPTLDQKKVMSANRLRAENWWVVGQTDLTLTVKSKVDGRVKVLDKKSR